MNAHGIMATSNLSQMQSVNRNSIQVPCGTRLAAPLSSYKSGSAKRTGGDGDGGTAGWKRSTVSATTQQMLTARLEKPTIASTLRAASNRNRVLSQKTASPRKTERLVSPRRLSGGAPRLKKEKVSEVQDESRNVQPILEIGVQANEADILNCDLLVGDIKILMPSPEIAKEIDKARLQKSKPPERPKMRRFLPHEHDQEQHLDELKQFMEHSYVTRRKPKKPPLPVLSDYELHEHRLIFKSMDEFLKRDIPKTEPVTNLKERIKRKEEELMSMFDAIGTSEKAETGSETE